jgi:two-component system, sensor histidine kinase LadS
MKRGVFFLILFSWVLLVGCNSKEVVRDRSNYFLLEDSSLQLSAAKAWQLFREEKFQAQASHSFNPGFTESYYWLVVEMDTIANESMELEIGTSQINEIEFYAIERDSPVKKFVTGDHNIYASRPKPTLNYNFPLAPGSKFFLLRVDKRNESLQLSFNVRPASIFQHLAIESTLVIGLLTGMIVLMLIFGSYLTIITRERVYLYYMLYVAAGWLYVLANQGYGYKYLWPGEPWFNSRARITFALLTIGFSLHFLELYAGKAAYRWLRIIIRSLAYFSYGLVVVGLIPFVELKANTAGYYFQAIVPALSAIYLLSILIFLTEKILKKNKMAMFYLLSITPIAVFSALQLFYYSGGLDFSGSFLRHYGQATGYILEAIILTFGLAYRFNTYRLEKEHLLIRVNQQQVKYTQAIITTQEQERRHLADQLHDVAGSLLSSAKLNLSSVREKNFINDSEVRVKLNHAEDAVTTISEMLRNLSHAISPVMLDKVGFRQSVEKVSAIFNASRKIRVESEIVGFETEQSAMHEKYAVLYGILYVLLNNITKHAQASHALIQLIEHDESIVMIVEDNGKGLDKAAAAISTTHGLAAIQSKIHYLKGSITFDDATPHGLIVTIEIPKE